MHCQLIGAAKALVYLHGLGVVHGDIKAENILISDDDEALLGDFGLSKLNESATISALKGSGSVRWQAPELLDEGAKTFQSDVYAFGMTIVEVSTPLFILEPR